MRSWAENILASIVIGAILGGISGYFITPGRPGIDVEYRGFPLEWRSNVIPTHIVSTNWANLALDVAFWIIITFIVLTIGRLVLGDKKGREGPRAEPFDR